MKRTGAPAWNHPLNQAEQTCLGRAVRVRLDFVQNLGRHARSVLALFGTRPEFGFAGVRRDLFGMYWAVRSSSTLAVIVPQRRPEALTCNLRVAGYPYDCGSSSLCSGRSEGDRFLDNVFGAYVSRCLRAFSTYISRQCLRCPTAYQTHFTRSF